MRLRVTDEALVIELLNALDGRLTQKEINDLKRDVDAWLTRQYRKRFGLRVIDGGNTKAGQFPAQGVAGNAYGERAQAFQRNGPRSEFGRPPASRKTTEQRNG